MAMPTTYKKISKIEGGVFVENRGCKLEAAGRPRKYRDIKMTSKQKIWALEIRTRIR